MQAYNLSNQQPIKPFTLIQYIISWLYIVFNWIIIWTTHNHWKEWRAGFKNNGSWLTIGIIDIQTIKQFMLSIMIKICMILESQCVQIFYSIKIVLPWTIVTWMCFVVGQSNFSHKIHKYTACGHIVQFRK